MTHPQSRPPHSIAVAPGEPISDEQIKKAAASCWKEFDTEAKWQIRFARAVLALRPAPPPDTSGDAADAAFYRWICQADHFAVERILEAAESKKDVDAAIRAAIDAEGKTR